MLVQIGSSWPTEKPGGVPTYFRFYLRELAKQVGRNRIVGYVAGSPFLAQDTGNLVHSLGSLCQRKISRYVQITKTLKPLTTRKNVIFCSHYLPHILPILSRLNPQNFVFHFHGPAALEARVEGKGKLYCKAVWQLERAVYKKAAYLTTVSEAFASLVTETYGIPLSRVHAVPGAIELERHSWSEKLNRVGQPLQLFCARRLVKRVGVDVLIRAAAVLDARRVKFNLRIAGEGPEKNNLESLIEELHLKNRIRLLGRISDEQLCEEYQRADLSVVPTKELEGFGLVILESLAAGTPVIGTRVGAIPEILEALGPHFLAKPDCQMDLADKITFIANHRQYLPSPSACREFVETRYSPRLTVRRHLELYQHYFGRTFVGDHQTIPFQRELNPPQSENSAA